MNANTEAPLSAGELTRIRDLINDKQDRLFKDLHALVAAGLHDRAQTVREALKYWDEVDRKFARVVGNAWDAQHYQREANP